MSNPIPIFDPEDPQLTAYALGELADPAERAEVERLLQHSPEAQLAMKEIQDLTKTLVAEYDEERRTTAKPAAPTPLNVIDLASHRASWTRPLLAIAAALLLLGVLAALILPVLNTRTNGARRRVITAAQQPLPKAPSPPPAVAAAPAVADHDLLAANATPATGNVPPSEAKPEIASLGAESSAASPTSSVALPGNVDGLALTLPAQGEAQHLMAQTDAGKALREDESRSSYFKDNSAGEKKNEAEPRLALRATPAAAKPRASASGGAAPAYQYPTQFQPPAIPQTFTANGPSAFPVTPTTPVTRETLAKAKDRVTANSAAPEFSSLDDADAVTDKPEVRAKLKTEGRFNTAAYDHLVENAFLPAKENPLSTFSIDVDTASYANVRRFIDGGSLPPPDAVRLEELINYFPYDYAPPTAEDNRPFAVHLEAAACPWAPDHRLVRVGIKGKEVALDKRPASNLVFLLDVSGSMQPAERLPLVKEAMRLLTEQLTENDHVAIVTYAGNSGLVLPSTSGDHKEKILAALDNLAAGGSTNGASGITLAYKTARENFIKGGTNRVILATDGDFNVGVTSQGDLVRLIQEQAKSGVFLSALGVGTDNYKDSTMQKLADKGNGNYNYIDRLEEARKVLVEQMSGTLLTIAKDVKIQVEFNPAQVSAYRLIGYEKRALRKEDFNDDKIDAGEIGAGHRVTALYEIVPVGQPTPGETPAVDALKYASKVADAAAPGDREKEEAVATRRVTGSTEMLTVKLRHKAPEADKSERTYEIPFTDGGAPGDYAKASPDFKFAAAVAAFGLALRDSPYKGGATFGAAVELAQEGKGSDPKGYRTEFINMVLRAQSLKDAQ